MDDAATGRHPLYVASLDDPFVSDAVAVGDGAGEDVGDRFDSAMRVPRKAGQVVFWPFVAEVIEKQERIEI